MKNIITSIEGKECSTNVESKRFKERIIHFTDEVNSKTADSLISELRYLDSISSEDIILYINSPGGSVTDGLAIYDCISDLHSDVVTIVHGMAASMGAFLLACAGTKGKRYASPNSEIMIHQPLGGMQGQASDIKIHAERILKMKKKLNKIFAEKTGQKLSVIEKDTDRDNFMSAEDALKYGIVDHIGYPNFC